MNDRTQTGPQHDAPQRLTLNRRTFLAASAFLAAGTARAQRASIPIIDTHMHFYDTTRPQGAPYPGRNAAPNLPIASPETFRKVAVPYGIVGAIEIEASPWIEDNLWALELAQKDPFMVGTIGNLEPQKPEFREYLDRYRKNPLFRGIRYGNIWDRSLVAQVESPVFVDGIRAVAAAGLTFDTANPNTDLIRAVVRLTDQVPDLRVVLDHLPSLEPPADPAALRAYEHDLRELAKRNVYAKVSQVLRRVKGQVPTDLAFYKPRLDMLWDVFGEDRLLFGSDWPNSAGNWVSYASVVSIVQDYFMDKGRPAAEKYFWKNSIAAYKWVRRDPSQPAL